MIKTLKELRATYGKDLQGIKDFQDLKDASVNFIRMVTWKKEKDHDYISRAFVDVLSYVIKDIVKNGYNEAMNRIKLGNLHKAYNIKYVYSYYGLDYVEKKKALKIEKITILGE